MTVTEADLNPPRERPGVLPKHVRGLLLHEGLACRGLFLGTLAVYLIFGWGLLVFFHPGWIIGIGVLSAVLIASRLGGSDAAEGSEEFAFSLPPTRAERYLVRMSLGLAAVLALTVVGTLSIAFDLPQLAWGVFVETGFTEPFPAARPLLLYSLAVAIPFAAFGFTFLAAAEARTAGGAGASWFLGLLATGVVVLGGLIAERLLWGGATGLILVPVLIALGAGALGLGYALYRWKEGVARPTSVESRGGSFWVWVVLVILVALFLTFFAWVS